MDAGGYWRYFEFALLPTLPDLAADTLGEGKWIASSYHSSYYCTLARSIGEQLRRDTTLGQVGTNDADEY